jgi:UDP-GlcNAc:undecaprenyl-phosphate GlcNAc-1-phosphate transferase
MGDAGSHFLGFTLAAISLNLRYSHQNGLAVLSPLVILFLPLYDLALMIVLRTRKGIPPWKGSPDHVALRLKVKGLSVPRIAGLLSALTFALGMLVYAASFMDLGVALWVWGGLAVLALAAAAWLMGIRMPHDVPPVEAVKPFQAGGKRSA